MDKIRITGLKQGKKEFKIDPGLPGAYAIGFCTKYGTVWVPPTSLLMKFKYQNRHLWELIGWKKSVDERDLIGRYIFVTSKQEEREIDGVIYKSPRL